MKSGRNVLILFLLVIVAATAGLIILARAPMMPPVQKVEQVIPDDHIPR